MPLLVDRVALVVAYLVLIPVLVTNLRWWAVRLLAVGFLMNFLVMAVHGGAMPTTPEAVAAANMAHRVQTDGTLARSKDIVLPREQVRLYYLSDRFVTHVPTSTVYSLGDLFLAGGLLLFLAEFPVRAFLSASGRRAMAVPGASHPASQTEA